MVSPQSVEQQLKDIQFNSKSWGKAEVSELPNILLEDEKIFECVNGYYEGGFALLVGTNIRLLLIDKKIMNYLTVEDLRFDMINQIDYSHRVMGARINVSAGSKNLTFTSYNQKRLRKLINHIQHRMAEMKTQQHSSAETQQQHLEKINQQLQAYLLAQHQHQEELRKQLEQANKTDAPKPVKVTPVKPAPELADFLYAQSLIQHHEASTGVTVKSVKTDIAETTPVPAPMLDNDMLEAADIDPIPQAVMPAPMPQAATTATETVDKDSLIAAGRLEVFGSRAKAAMTSMPLHSPFSYRGMEINPLKVAYSKLPTLLRQRKYNKQLERAKVVPETDSDSGALPNGTQIAGA